MLMLFAHWLFDLLVLPLLTTVLRFKDDDSLVARLQRRDPEAMGDLYDRYGKVAFSVIYRIVRNQSTAEDLLQESFLRVWNRVHAFDQDKGSLGPWVLTVARNRAIDYLRSVDGRMSKNAFDIERMESPGGFAEIETSILNRDQIEHLKGAFDKLSPNQRMVIELAYFEGLSQSEMADRLKQPLGTVKTWVRSALKTLRDELTQTEAIAR
jgi:RNA polymerase sigma-70 factor, ECF subfamily